MIGRLRRSGSEERCAASGKTRLDPFCLSGLSSPFIQPRLFQGRDTVAEHVHVTGGFGYLGSIVCEHLLNVQKMNGPVSIPFPHDAAGGKVSSSMSESRNSTRSEKLISRTEIVTRTMAVLPTR